MKAPFFYYETLANLDPVALVVEQILSRPVSTNFCHTFTAFGGFIGQYSLYKLLPPEWLADGATSTYIGSFVGGDSFHLMQSTTVQFQLAHMRGHIADGHGDLGHKLLDRMARLGI